MRLRLSAGVDKRTIRPLVLLLVALVPLLAILRFAGTGTAEPAAATTPALAPTRTVGAMRRHAAGTQVPSAAKFGLLFAGASNQYGHEHSVPGRIRRVHCVQASRGHYMCSYAVVRTGAPSECHLIQARWTPDAPSTFTVTLSGRTTRCSSLGEAIRSLG